MLGQEVPEPRLWKALVPALFISVPLSAVWHLFFPHSPLWPWLTFGVLMGCAVGYQIHRRAVYDSQAQWSMNFATADKTSQVERDVRTGP
ncbi:MAG TPA: hypothetical protein VFL13_10980 [Candidatus Baltobacteraceae bacterium]|nr:hypothetical protein [Candidatus Baltobacteraceae bacterium]